MTVVVAAYTPNGVVIAADAQTTAGSQKSYNETPKIWLAGDLGFGGSGCLRSVQVMKYHVDWVSICEERHDLEWEPWLVKQVVPAIHDAAGSHGTLRNNDGVLSTSLTLLACTGNEIAEISGNGAVCVEAAGRSAIGSGYAEALGALGNDGPWSTEEVIAAARRATFTNWGCSGPITVMNVRTKSIWTVE